MTKFSDQVTQGGFSFGQPNTTPQTDPVGSSSTPTTATPGFAGQVIGSGFGFSDQEYDGGASSALQNAANSKAGKITLGLLTTAGKVLQPFMAPQQILFGAVSWSQKALSGDFKGAGDDFSRALGAAGDYATWGYTARPNMLGWGDKKDARDSRVSGYQLAKNAGYADYIAKPLGLAADFILDVPLLGTIGKVAKIDETLDITLGLERMASANMAHAFTRAADNSIDYAGLRKFAVRVAATPFSTAPIHDLATGLPAYYRESLAKTAAGIIEDGLKVAVPLTGKSYTVLGGRAAPVLAGREAAAYGQLGPTIAEAVVSKFGGIRGLPRMSGQAIADLRNGKVTGTGIGEKLEKYIYQVQSEAGSISLRAAQAQAKYDDVASQLSAAGKEEFDRIAYSILDWDKVSQFHKGLADLEALGNRLGNPAFKEQALKALWESSSLDTYLGLLRFKNGTMEAEKISGNFQGLRILERAAFGQPKTANPLATRFAQDAIDARAAGLKPVMPDPGLHFRRQYKIQFQPQDIIHQAQAQALPGVMHQIDESRLARTLLDSMNITATKQGMTAQQFMNARPHMQAAADSIAADFTTMFKGRTIDERAALSQLLQKHGMAGQEAHILKTIGDEWWQKAGIAYRPPSNDVVAKLREMADNPGMVIGSGSYGSPLGTNRSVLQGRTDMPDWLRESMGEIHDISQILESTKQIGTKQHVNRSTVQVMYDMLKAEGGLMTKEELALLPGGGHNNWRRVTPDLAARLKAMGDSHGGQWGDIPFKGDEYIPASYHNLLVSASTIDDPNVVNATFSYLMQAWKGHKVGNVASIVRDTLTNYRFAMDFGIRPDQLSRAVAAGITLTNRATEGGVAGRLRGKRPDVLDDKAFVVYRGTKITMQELTEVGGMFHGSFFVNEMQEPYRALRDNLASSRGDGTQGAVAAILDFTDAVRQRVGDAGKSGNVAARVGRNAGIAAAGAADLVTGLGGPVTKMLQDIKGSVDVIYKLGVYMHKRSEGVNSLDAARYADELLFNYQNQPLMVDYLRRNGISPFASFQFMSAGRFMRSVYENPYAVDRWYRLPQSMSEGDERTQGEIQYTAPEYMRSQLWLPLFDPFSKKKDGKATRDSEGRSMFLNLSAVMPESSIFNMTGSDAISQWIPPHVELVTQLVTGKGYADMPIYDGGKSLSETLATGNKNAFAKGLVKALHQFGASPWAPGSPQADRLAKALLDAAVPADQVANDPQIQAWLKFQSLGLFAMGLQDTPIVPQRIGAAAPLDPKYAALRTVGITTAPVTGYAGKPGSARGNLTGAKKTIGDLRYMMVNDIKNAGADPRAVEKIVAKYMPLIAQQAQKIDRARQFMENYEQLYQSDMPTNP